MDIDSPSDFLDPNAHDGHTHHLLLPPLSASFPLPFRVLVLIGFAILLWAINLHVLHLLGIDVGWILDFRDGPEGSLSNSNGLTFEAGHEEGGGLGNLNAESMELGYLDEAGNEKSESTIAIPNPTTGSLLPPTTSASSKVFTAPRVDSSKLHQPIYKLFLLYSAWVSGGWLVFRVITGGEVDSMERWRGLIALVVLGAGAGAIVPWRGVAERERRALKRCIQRILLPPLTSPIYFCDVILADILTSFAKVLGDLWVSACQIYAGGVTEGRITQSGWSRWITLSMVCLPYALRFRQCIHELHQSNYSSPRPLANSLKYLSAFPVILLSAAQKIVVHEIAEQKGLTVEQLGQTHDRWFGEHPLFRLWLLAVVVNSMFSFYWDVEMDWGLALCEVDTWLPKRESLSPGSIGLGGIKDRGSPGSKRLADLTFWGRIRQLFSSTAGRNNNISHQRSPHPSPGPFQPRSSPHSRSPSHIVPHGYSPSHPGSAYDLANTPFTSAPIPTSSRFFAFGLRPTLLLPDPIVYHIFSLVDLVLRLTWSLKLSSHLHTIAEIETGVFLMEGLELLRRWMWIFVRIEWEGVKMGEVARFGGAQGQGQVAGAKGRVGLGLKDAGRMNAGVTLSAAAAGNGSHQVLWSGDELDKH